MQSHSPAGTVTVPMAIELPPAQTTLNALDLSAQKIRTDASVEDAERQFIARGNSPYAEFTTPHTRVLRDGQFPIDGTAAINEYLKLQEGQWSWTVKLQGTSRANDFAYAVGNYTWQPKTGVARKGQYVRVWVRDADGATSARWTLAGEVLTPEPPPKQ